MSLAVTAARTATDTSSRKSWRWYCALLAILFVIRGLFLLCFFPPLEGPDEYQHIAYLVSMHERGAAPVFGRTLVPTSLYSDLVALPHSDYDWAQTRAIGNLRYKHFPLSRPEVTSLAPIGLYQAQQPPLYYWLLSPLYAWLRANLGFRAAVYTLRFLNLVCAGAGFALLLHPLRLVFGLTSRARLAALMISLLPMALVYVCRVSNDALALLCAGLAVLVLEGVPDNRLVLQRCAAAGVLLGLGVWVKLTVFAFLPAALLWIALLSALRWLPFRRGLTGVAVLSIAYLVVAGGYHLHNLREFHTPFAAQETVRNAAVGRTWADIVSNIRVSQARSFFWERMVVGNLWTSGWSFLKPYMIWTRLFQGFFILSFAGGAVGLLRHFSERKYHVPLLPRRTDPCGCDRSAVALSLLCGLVAGFSFLGAYVHALHSLSAHGGIVTPPYYVIPGFPYLLALAFLALDGFGSRRLWYAGVTALGFLFIATECHSLFAVALPYWTNSREVTEMWHRTSFTHPIFPSPWAAPGIAVVVGAIASVVLWQVPSKPGHGSEDIPVFNSTSRRPPPANPTNSVTDNRPS